MQSDRAPASERHRISCNMAGLENLRILGFGNPLLDISAVVDDAEFPKWKVKAGDIVLADPPPMGVGIDLQMYKDYVKSHEVEYIAGGATQNTIRVAQWVTGAAGATGYVGSVGADENGAMLEKCARADGVNVQYMKQPSTPTGTCAVLVSKEGERALVTNLAAANEYTKDHYDSPEIQAMVKATKIFYSAGFFITVSVPTLKAYGEHCSATGKTMCMNLSAPFICQVPPFRMALDNELMPHVDILFGNETEAAAYGSGKAIDGTPMDGWGCGTEDVGTIALKIAAMPKASGTRPRVVVFTQGKDPTLVACGGVLHKFPVPALPKEQLVDTNGAGDAFVGGFLAKLACGCDLETCVTAGNYAARQIIQVAGCKIPSFPAAI